MQGCSKSCYETRSANTTTKAACKVVASSMLASKRQCRSLLFAGAHTAICTLRLRSTLCFTGSEALNAEFGRAMRFLNFIPDKRLAHVISNCRN
eukprot:6379339-Amphidinium_carterae.2